MLFEPPRQPPQTPVLLAPDFWLLRSFAEPDLLLPQIDALAFGAPFRKMRVPGGKQMSVAMTNCGAWGWTASEQGYAYTQIDPISNARWPSMPTELEALASQAATATGWGNFVPNACLINRYESGAGMGLHQDKDEQDLTQPIVSVSLGSTCKFLIGGSKRSDATRSITLNDGDVLVWGGVSRLVYHGVRSMPKTAETLRYNLTFRKAK